MPFSIYMIIFYRLQELSKVSHVRLDREQITSMDLELFSGSVTNLYLQHVSKPFFCSVFLVLLLLYTIYQTLQ